ncbi:hypothetical protein SAMN05421767_10611 [Granulicatella balaenopterae]|uniref:DUF2313 domain-containing protein n=2 Tax=Granulicatella balaenopterae TaxID=137733 RepID=A0A1H9IK61_9LACT|nr:hypothetical protein SAMN05421767_10611 [Granulicatella balaenopterae]
MSQVKKRMLEAIPKIKDDTIIDLLEAEAPELELITSLIDDTKKLIMIPHANLEWVERWEKSLNIKPQTKDLDERKRYLTTVLTSKVKISSETLEEITENFTGVQARVKVRNSTVFISFLGAIPKAEFNRYNNYIRQLIPAHLGIQLVIDAPMQQTLYTAAIASYSYKIIKFKGGK